MSAIRLIAVLITGFFILISSINLLYHYPVLSGGDLWRFIQNEAPPTSQSLQKVLEAKPQQYLLGVGKADITGPVVEINFMGYANPSQVGTGLRQRIFSRAFMWTRES